MQAMLRRISAFVAVIKNWIVGHKKLSILIGVLILLAIGTGIFFLIKNRQAVNRTDSSAESSEQELPKLLPSPLTGVEVTRDLAERPVIGVMIENSPEARPQSGLADAGVVFEAIAEGGITRMLVLYQEDSPENIGPIRSVRPYYVDWAEIFKAALAHVGGSPDGLARAKALLGNSRDLDEFKYGRKVFDRVSFRSAPHNVYSSLARILEAARGAGHNTSNFTSLPRKAAEPSATPNATAITVNFSSKLFQIGWTYDAATNSYARSAGGTAVVDKHTSAVVKANVVVVMKASYTSSGGSGRQAVGTTGSGEAVVFQDGVATTGSWTRSEGSQYLLKNTAGVEIKLNAGRTWFEVIPTSQSVTYQ